MFANIERLIRSWAGRSQGDDACVVIGPSKRPRNVPVIAVDFEGAARPRADAALTCVEPSRVLAVARYLHREGLPESVWLICGLDALPYSFESQARFLVDLCRSSRRTVHVDVGAWPSRQTTRLMGHLNRHAASLRRRGLSPTVRVLSSDA
jgi:hypothetical protein